MDTRCNTSRDDYAVTAALHPYANSAAVASSFAHYEFDADGNFCAVHTYIDATGRRYSNRTILSNPAARHDAYLAAREREWQDFLHRADGQRHG